LPPCGSSHRPGGSAEEPAVRELGPSGLDHGAASYRGPLFASASDRDRARSLLALNIITLHIALVAALGQHYVKIQLPFGTKVYVTELALGLAMVFGWRGVTRVPWDRLTKLIAVFLIIGTGWALVGGLGDSGAGIKAFSFFVYAGFYFVIRGNATTDEDRYRILRAIVLASFVGAAIGVVQMQTGTLLLAPDNPSYAHETATGVSRWLPGEFSVYGMVGLIIVGMPQFLEMRMTAQSGLFLLPPAITLILAQHRSGFLAFAFALLATAAFLVGSKRMWKGLLKLTLFATAIVVVFVVLFGGAYLDNTLVRIQHTFDTEDGNAVWRLVSWMEVFEGVQDRPLGHGFAQWDFFFNMSQPLVGSHNCYLDLAYRIGIPGLAAFVAIPTELVRQTRASVQQIGPRAALVPVVACTGLIAFLVFSFFNMVIEIPMMSIFFWVLAGIGASALASPTQKST
jgi:hypothetical protein